MLRLTLLASIALVLVGCDTAARPHSQTAVDTFPPTEQVKALQLPLDAYSFSDAQLYTISEAQDVLIAKCMRGKGHTWESVQRPTDAPDLRNRRRYGVVETEIARFGYHVPTGLLTPASLEQAYERQDKSLSDSAKEAAYGEDGCGHEAAEALGTNDDPDHGLLVQSSRSSLYDTLREPAVVTALKSWRDCMHQAGFRYEDPLAAMADQQWWSDESAGPSEQEVATAVADVTCKDRSDLVSTWHAAEVRFQEQVVTAHSDYFAKLHAEMERQLDAAEVVLAR